MLLVLIIVGLILRSVAPTLFYIFGIVFLAFLIYTAIAEIKDRNLGWSEGLASGFYIIITLWLMLH